MKTSREIELVLRIMDGKPPEPRNAEEELWCEASASTLEDLKRLREMTASGHLGRFTAGVRKELREFTPVRTQLMLMGFNRLFAEAAAEKSKDRGRGRG